MTPRIIVATLVALSMGASAQVTESAWVTFSYFDGLRATTRAMVQDVDENVWMGGQYVTRYDGLRFVTFTDSVHFDLHSVDALLATRDSTIWAGAASGLLQYSHGTWHELTPSPILPSTRVTCLLEDRLGRIWVGTDLGLSVLENGIWRIEASGRTGRIVDLLEDNAGAIWVADPFGLSRFFAGAWETYPATGVSSISAITQDPNGILWIATETAGLFRFDPSLPWENVRDAKSRPSNARDVLADSDGFVWLATNEGVASYDPGTSTWQFYGVADGLTHPRVEGIFQTTDGALWFWDGFGDVSRFDKSTWQLFEFENLESAMAIAEEPGTHAMWCSTQAGMHLYSNGAWRHFEDVFGSPVDCSFGAPFEACDRVRSGVVDRSGKLRVGSQYHGVGTFSPSDSTFHFAATCDSISPYTVGSLFEEDSTVGTAIWFGTRQGLGRLDFADSSCSVIPKEVFGESGGVSSILRQRSTGDLWIGTTSGLAVQHSDGWVSLGPPDIPSDLVADVLETRSGEMWVATLNKGIARQTGSTWIVYDMNNGLVANLVRSLAEDSHGAIWVGSQGGVNRFYGGEWGGYHRNSLLAGANSVISASPNRLWFGTLNGMSLHQPDYVPPQTIITSPTHTVSGSRAQTVVFTVGFKETASEAQFSFSLDGAPWSAWSSTSFWADSSLSDTPPDHPHTLAVRAKDEIGNVDPTPAVATFTIDAIPPSPLITAPVAGSSMRGTAIIKAIVIDSRFKADSVWVRAAGVGSWTLRDATLLSSSSAPARDTLLVSWDTRPFLDGPYELRVAVTDSLGLTGSAIVPLIVDNIPPGSEITSPASVRASGGDVFTTNQEVHLYFPPGFFKDGAVVSIVPSANADVPDTQPSGAVRAMGGYKISWDGEVNRDRNGVPRKAARLELSYAEASISAGIPCLYVSANDTTWTPVGGSVEEGSQHISVNMSQSGRYALYLEPRALIGAATLADLSFSPRVFSPTGTYADREVSIGFTLGRPAPVTVRVYSRAGSLIKEVASGTAMNTGANIVRWNGRDRREKPVPDGLYLVTVQALGHTERKTIAVVK